MKKLGLALALICLASGFFFAHGEGTPIKGAHCPVSGDQAVKEVSYEYKGKTYHFCCPPCVKKFKKHPEKYLHHE